MNFRQNSLGSLRAENSYISSAKRGPLDNSRSALGDITSTISAIQRKPRSGTSNVRAPANARRITPPNARTSGRLPRPTFPTSQSSSMDVDIDTLNDCLNNLNFIDIDAEDAGDPQNCPTYIHDIMDHLFRTEMDYVVAPTYMARQQDVTSQMRVVLVDWLIEVHMKFKLMQETLYLCISLVDRYFSKVSVRRSQIQLVGVTALLIASKMEEMYTPEVQDFVYITDDAYTIRDITRMELHILSTVNFDLTPPTPLHFLRRFSKAARSDLQSHTLAKYICEITMLSYEMLAYRPSIIAASATFIAHKMLHRAAWNSTLTHYSRCTEEDIKPCSLIMIDLLKKMRGSSFKAIVKKYQQQSYSQVANLSTAML